MPIPIWVTIGALALVFTLAMAIANMCVKKGLRLLGVITAIAIGGASIYLGYILAIQGFTDGYYVNKYPVTGWILIIGGVIIALFGIWVSMATSKKYKSEK